MKKSAKSTSRAMVARSRRAVAPSTQRLLADVRELIEAARQQVAQTVNSTLVALYWHIGKRIREDILNEQRAEYGERIVSTLSKQLTAEYDRGFDPGNLSYMIRFAEKFPEERIVNALRSQLSWTHFRELIAFDDPLKRDFYAEMCRIERWSTRTLRKKNCRRIPHDFDSRPVPLRAERNDPNSLISSTFWSTT
jgi:predicted nuclease of restriction endonuclease-like (RecB) superfamily